MKPVNLDYEIFKSKVIVHRERYAYLKTKKSVKGRFFMVSEDRDEKTIIATEQQMKKIKYEKAVRWYTMFEVRTNTPFECVGFLARITNSMAKMGLTVLIVSTFSKDYVLIKERETSTAVEAFREAGFINMRKEKA